MDSLLSLIIGFLLALVFYYFDLRKGGKLYRTWHNISHKDALPNDVKRGFVFNQPFSMRLVPAVFISALICFMFFITGGINILVLLIYGLMIMLGLVVGFSVAPTILKSLPSKLSRVKNTLNKVDVLEEKFKMKDEVVASETEPIKKEEPQKPLKEDAPNKKSDDWRKGIGDYLDK